MPVCSECATENPDIAKFCLACGSPLTPPVPVEEERKLDTLLFVDMVGSTSRAEQLDPEDVLGLLQPYYLRLRRELERFGGTVEKYIGDAVVCHFGVPVAHEDDPERAVRAAFAILDAINTLNAEDPSRELAVRIGIATGEAIVTLGARAEEGKGISWGDILNTAARIEGAAPIMGILVGEETYRASAHAIEYREHEPIAAKGKAKPVPVFEAVAIKQTAGRRASRDAPLVGRSSELERMRSVWESVQTGGRSRLVTVTGGAGIGKTRLVVEFVAGIGEAARAHWGRCLSYGEGITYWPVIEIVSDIAGVLQSDDVPTISAKLDALLVDLGTDDVDELRTIAAALSNVMGAPTTPRGTYSAAQISQAELHWGIRRTLELLAARRPVVVVLDDLQWAEPTLLDLIEYLESEAAGPILVVCSARQELAELRPSLLDESRVGAAIALGALEEDESEALLSELVGDREGALRGHVAALLRVAGGNPLFLEETVRMLVESGFLGGEGEAPPGADVGPLPVPTSLQALIGSRLDSLAAQEKRTAQHASVGGVVFWSGAVEHISEGESDVDRRLEALEQRDFVRSHELSSVEGEREWGFKHLLTRDVAYGRVPKGRRIGLHVRFAEWISGLPGGEDEFLEIIAYHLEQACRLAQEVGRSETAPPVERAVSMLMRAADRAQRREGIREADRYYARALELVGEEVSEQALEVQLGRAGTLNLLGDLQRADGLFAEVASAAARFGNTDLQARALIGRANIARKQSRGAEARSYAATAESIAMQSADRTLQVRAIYEAANVRSWFDATGEAAVADLQRALEIAEDLDDTPLRIDGHVRMVVELYNLGELGAAEEHCLHCLALAGETGSLRDEARVTFQLALVKHHQGEVDEAERLGLQALEWLERTGERSWQLQTLRALGLSAIARADLALADERLRQAIPLALELELGNWLVVDIYPCLIDVAIGQGRLRDAHELAELALKDLPAEEPWAQAVGLMIQAKLATADGRRDDAVDCFGKALRVLEEQRLPLDLGEARVAYGRALLRLGEAERGAAELAAVRVDLERMGARGLVAEIDRELAELAEGAGSSGPLHS